MILDKYVTELLFLDALMGLSLASAELSWQRTNTFVKEPQQKEAKQWTCFPISIENNNSNTKDHCVVETKTQTFYVLAT